MSSLSVYIKAIHWLALTFFLSLPALAQEAVLPLSLLTPSKDPIPINLLTGQSRLLVFDEAYGRVATPNQDIAESVPVEAKQLLITGKTPGRATLVVWAKDGARYIFVELDVRSNLTQLDAQMRALLPQENIQLSQANGAVVLSGKVSTVSVIQRAETIAQSFGVKTVNLLTSPVVNESQVQLLVRVAEVNRNKVRELAATPVYQPRAGTGGYANSGSGPFTLGQVDGGGMLGSVASSLNLFLMNSNAFLYIRALQSQGALRALAEPNLVAMNGQQASFLAGGEIPIPMIQNGGANGAGAVNIQFKEYGVRLNFKPVIIDEDHIRLELEPEVSTLDYSNAVRLSGFQIPALRSRKAKTSVELRDGQSFALAGLLDNNEVQAMSKVPGLGTIPLLGALFTSKQFQKQETELVFFVTAQLTKPVNADAVPTLKGLEGLKESHPLTDRSVEPPSTNRRSRQVKSESSASPGVIRERSTEPPSDTKPLPKPTSPPPSSPSRAIATEPVLSNQETRFFERLSWQITIPEFNPPPPAQVRREQ